VPASEFADFTGDEAGTQIGKSASVGVEQYTDLVDLIFGLRGVLYATESGDDEEEDPVFDPDQCEWLAGGLERFVASHREVAGGREVTFESLAAVLHAAVSEGPQRRWLDARLAAYRDATGATPRWRVGLGELAMLGRFYRRCAERGFAVYADY